MSKQESGAIAREIQTQILVLGGLAALMWITEFIDIFFFRGRLDAFGIRPHSFIGLRGILFAPFLHGGLGHLIANTIPFLTLGWLVMLRETSDFFVVSIVTMLVSGLGVWLTGSPYSIHVGASGVIFGYFGFLLLRGYFERSFAAILFSLVVGFLYGGMIWGVLPSQYGISWQGHLFGFIGGAIAARLLAKPKKRY
ncbi:rhomboid family intramembrane serine protease [Chroococcidiopsis sp. FACHB-1243]|uniref:rhomboid family intramembrane serine protease n=1 Tax=Chroococcidiopsis sp. [FACHB-1243] TaxID=2692781 RepID=UPI00177E5666|nr:rhomboid family intramembrane serine protease [Chroococcidiopsis sp. [FACHB-1243]]MBD2304925.1 rhomboid family intramembrane serine protease [Chroococcidiopsis sp. [FACHB-1243]]